MIEIFDRRGFTRLVALDAPNCIGADFRGQNLKEANLIEMDLQRSDFTGANLTGADLRLANLRGAIFVDADLTRVNFSGADLSGAEFSGANLAEAVLPERWQHLLPAKTEVKVSIQTLKKS